MTKRGDIQRGYYNWLIRCCIFSFTVWYALRSVCSLITISVVSAFGLLTRDAIVVESVSTITLLFANTLVLANSPAAVHVPVVDRLIQTKENEVKVLQHTSLFDLITKQQKVGLEKCNKCSVQYQLIL